jgi:hypothetical protein
MNITISNLKKYNNFINKYVIDYFDFDKSSKTNSDNLKQKKFNFGRINVYTNCEHEIKDKIINKRFLLFQIIISRKSFFAFLCIFIYFYIFNLYIKHLYLLLNFEYLLIIIKILFQVDLNFHQQAFHQGILIVVRN